MSDYTKVNLLELEDSARAYGIDGVEARFARGALGARGIGLSHQRLGPGQRLPFGHRHQRDEEVYVVLAGSGRFALDNEITEVSAHDALYVAPATLRAWEAGPEGLEFVAFGAHHDDDAEQQMGWWPQ